jgi:exodeoxyribonuclease VII small subunit
MPEPPQKKAASPGETTPAPAATLSFESGLQQLESIVKEMESGELPLERALELFENGMKLSDTCRKQLEEAETRVEILMKRAGDVTPQPFRPDKA